MELQKHLIRYPLFQTQKKSLTAACQTLVLRTVWLVQDWTCLEYRGAKPFPSSVPKSVFLYDVFLVINLSEKLRHDILFVPWAEYVCITRKSLFQASNIPVLVVAKLLESLTSNSSLWLSLVLLLLLRKPHLEIMCYFMGGGVTFITPIIITLTITYIFFCQSLHILSPARLIQPQF